VTAEVKEKNDNVPWTNSQERRSVTEIRGAHEHSGSIPRCAWFLVSVIAVSKKPQQGLDRSEFDGIDIELIASFLPHPLLAASICVAQYIVRDILPLIALLGNEYR
jgi:hypothetical protein